MSTPQSFQRVEDEYFRLRGQLATGRITRQQFEDSLRALIITDAQGRHWMLGTDSGKWFMHDGKQWTESDPYDRALAAAAPATAARSSPPPREPNAPPPTYPPPAAFQPPPAASQPPPAAYQPSPSARPQTGGGCGRFLLLSCLVAVLACVLFGAGGFVAVQSGALTTASLLNLAGLGPGDISVNNLRDAAIAVDILQLDTTGDDYPTQGALELNAFDIKNFRAFNPGRYRVTFSSAPDSSELGECVIRINSGDVIQFVALPAKIVVYNEQRPPSKGTDLIVAASALCRAQ